MRRVWGAVLAGVLAVSPAAGAATLVRQPSYVDAQGQVRPWRLVSGKWGFLADLNAAAARALETCPGADTAATAGLKMAANRLDAGAAGALAGLRGCHRAWFAAADLSGDVPESLWNALLPGAPSPSPLERAKLLAAGAASLTPDYDQAVWDWARQAPPPSGGAYPDGPILTWGPFKATAGQGCTLQKTLAALMAEPATAAIVRSGFTGEAALLGELLDRRDPNWCANQAAILRPVFDDADRREGLRIILAGLGGHAEIRAGYDAYFLGPTGYLAGRMARYYRLYDQVGLTPTEVDFAFFLDRSLDYPPLSDGLIAALKPQIMQAGASNWRARATIAHQTPFTSDAARAFQIGRDAAYWIDGAGGQAELDPADAALWVRVSRLKASDVGLRERPYAPPCALAAVPRCVAAGGGTP